MYLTQQTKASESATRQVVASQEIEIPPEIIAAGGEEVRLWLSAPENYRTIEQGGIGNAAALVRRTLERSGMHSPAHLAD